MNAKATLLALCGLLLATEALAGVGLDESRAWVEFADQVAVIYPDGSGHSLADQSATVYVEFLDVNFDPVVNHPAADIWIENDGEGNLSFCVGGSIADAPTDATGHTQISHALAGGGYSPDHVRVMVGGVPVTNSPDVPLRIVSPDIDGDGDVDLADIGIFAADFWSTPRYAFRSDLYPNGVLDLADIAALAVGLGKSCP